MVATPSNKRKLKARETRVLASVAKGNTLTQAAIDGGYSEKSARNYGSELMKKPYMQEALADVLERVGITPERTMREFADIGYGSKRDVLKVRSLENIAEVQQIIGSRRGTDGANVTNNLQINITIQAAPKAENVEGKP